MPEWPALCDLGAPGWGEPWFPPQCCVVFSHMSIVWRVVMRLLFLVLVAASYPGGC